jgi:hypothetical protein
MNQPARTATGLAGTLLSAARSSRRRAHGDLFTRQRELFTRWRAAFPGKSRTYSRVRVKSRAQPGEMGAMRENWGLSSGRRATSGRRALYAYSYITCSFRQKRASKRQPATQARRRNRCDRTFNLACLGRPSWSAAKMYVSDPDRKPATGAITTRRYSARARTVLIASGTSRPLLWLWVTWRTPSAAGGATELLSRKVVSVAPGCLTTAPRPPAAWRKFSQARSGLCAPGRIRTRDPLLRRQLLCPAELRALGDNCARQRSHAGHVMIAVCCVLPAPALEATRISAAPRRVVTSSCRVQPGALLGRELKVYRGQAFVELSRR